MTTQAAQVQEKAFSREVWILIGAAFVVAVGFGIVAPAIPQFARSFGVGPTAAATIVSTFAAFRLLFAPVGGRLSERFGERPVYLVGLLVVALSTAAAGLASSYGWLLAFRSVGGIGSTMFTVSAVALLVRLSPPTHRGRVSAAYGSAFLLGNVFGPVLGGLLAPLGLRAPFLIYGGSLLVAAVVVGLGIRPEAIRSPAGVGAVPPRMSVREAWGDPVYRACLTSGFANGWSNFGVRVALVPLFVVEVLHAGPQTAGFALAAFAVGNVAVLNHAGRLSDRIGRRPLVLGGLVLCGVFTAFSGVITNVWVYLAVMAVAGVGAGLLNPAQQAAVADVVGNERSAGTVLAGFQMAQDVGAILGPILVGLVAEHYGYGVAFALTGVVMGVALLVWIGRRETARAAVH
ncbi:MFS transporter [Kytococcus sp. HMSC28H12]|uniref:MFS transporter n=1 Tax=Kytococcus sp. HMSC28H12 TaxID=1581067 RepID=UPI0008A4BE0C|nr:MFS transporter [Kytococcus sp. HMSC28H12]OFS15745.1 arabinose ABC transporter permease [Kytococcus sp. HMSC28H12]